ncbi:hypothetical protein SAMN05660350_01007 [Geodermatophilus obscurus]|uniref:Potassium/proton antiporter subunit KhtT-like N-terminal domain-containing protein n=1 Tax=Geodermatophilus obscurus TaxID=1861 RepID=A0A1M7SQZ9_9ACTN|nr:hypothetical protein [Geodermatophilus obscurus]SHN60834.1 hypothetical protein SAMN05660350_01007 [Geodermatophilus obscurus]
MTDVHVQARRLPGVGWRYTIPADRGRQVVVVVEDRGPRHLALLDPRLDEALTTVRLPPDRASVLAALLTGARFTLDSSDGPAVDDRTPELVDPEGGRAAQEGDELVVAARRGRMTSLRSAV